MSGNEEQDIEEGVDNMQVEDDYGSDDYDYEDEGYDRHSEEWYQEIRRENPQFTDDEIALMIACSEQNLDNVQRLLSEGVNPNFSMVATTSPLYDAIVSVNIFPNEDEIVTWKAIIKALLDAGASPNTSGVPMLIVAFDRHDLEVIDWLIEHGADPNCGMSEGAIAGGTSILSSLFNFSFVQKVVTPKLIKLGADVCALSTASGWTPLHSAACNGRLQSTRLVIRAGCVATNKDSWAKSTPLRYVIKMGDKDTIKLLLYAGYNIHENDDVGTCMESVKEIFGGDTEFIDWFGSECSTPGSLKRQCRRAIRNVIGGICLEDKIKKSDFPEFLKPYLLLDELT